MEFTITFLALLLTSTLFAQSGTSFSLTSFPLGGLTPATAPINSVFDHSMDPAHPYVSDGVIAAYTGETGLAAAGVSSGNCYRNTPNTSFTVNGSYTGVACGGKTYLSYDGHSGYDFAAHSSTVVAAADGVVIVARPTNYQDGTGQGCQCYGNLIVISHNNGAYQTWYGHLKYNSFSSALQGTTISAGTAIAITDNTGDSTGEHLHFEVRKKIGVTYYPVDPYGWQGMGSDPYKFNTASLWLTFPAHSTVAIDPGVSTIITSSSSYFPFGLSLDGKGNLYVAESVTSSPGGQVIRVPVTGGTATMIGAGWVSPEGVALDSMGNLYVADCSTVAEVSAGGQTTVPLPQTQTCVYTDVAVDSGNNVYVVEQGQSVVKLPAGGGPPTPVGTGISYPFAIALDPQANAYVVDLTNNNVVKIPANNGAQSRIGSGLSAPYGVAVDTSGNAYITDVGNNRVVEVLAASGNQITIPIPSLLGPRRLAVDQSGVVYVSEFRGGFGGGNVLRVDRTQGVISFGNQSVGVASGVQTVSVTNQGPFPVTFQSPAYTLAGNTGDFIVQAGPTNPCISGGNLNAGANCTLAITFKPTVTGARAAQLVLNDNAANSMPQVVNLSGIGM
jgi:sugar lactone lactonase YvrE